MEVVGVAVLGALTSSVASKLFTVVENMCKREGKESKALEDNIDHMKKELRLIAATIESNKGQLSESQIISIEEFRLLAHKIEDCLDRFLPCAAWRGEQIHGSKKFRDEIAALRMKLDGAKGRKKDADEASDGAKSNVDDASHQDAGTYGAHPAVGIKEPKEELCKLLGGGETSKVKVISIVGFGGSGKTELAWAVYNCDDVKKKFSRRAWAVASNHRQDPEGFWSGILKELHGDEVQPVPQKIRQLEQDIRGLLKTQRCLIVIDDMKLEVWNKIKRILPEETASRILVTTALTPVANSCSLPGGYVYNMRSLSAEQSQVLLQKMVHHFQGPLHGLKDGLDAIVHTCVGHPLALVSVANSLTCLNPLTGDDCKEISENLCRHMDKDDSGNFTKLGQVLMNNYSSLPQNAKTCLLYASVFPNDHPFNTNSLIKRLSAEGYIECNDDRDKEQEIAYQNLKKLIDQNIIQSVDTSNNSKAKTCRTHGIMNQFTLHKSMASNFIATSFSAKNRSNFRHLVIENRRIVRSASTNVAGKSTAENGDGRGSKFVTSVKKQLKVFKLPTRPVSKKLHPRSLTVYGSAKQAIFSDLNNWQLLRVLDLKECDNFEDKHLKKIYELMHLKYLSLGKSVSNLSGAMERLHCLETLDLRKTEIHTLPVEVIGMPHLKHLFGKIKLKKVRGKNHQIFLEGKSNLQTLAGVVVDNMSGFPELMSYMKELTKVKIWCEIASTDRNYKLLSKAIQKYNMLGTDNPIGPRSLSLHLNDSSKDLLHHGQDNNADETTTKLLSSLKLTGRPTKFHEFVQSVSGLRELCLTSAELTDDDLPALRQLQCLVYLKLVGLNLGDLHIGKEDFQSVQRLCIVVQEPGFPTIQKGALPILVSLQLLCKDLPECLSDHIQVKSFERLQEIALDYTVDPETIESWKAKARTHPKRPRVLLLRRVDPADTRSGVKYVTTDEVSTKPPMPRSGEISSHTDQVSLEPQFLWNCSCEISIQTGQGSLEPPMQGTA